MKSTFNLYTDGGARGNPGPAAAGAVLYDAKNRIVFEISEYLGRMTNNQAEYNALLLGLNKAKNKGVQTITCHLDSELIVKQLCGEYRVKNEGMKKLFDEVSRITDGFKNVSFKHVKREKNKHADALVNKALDRQKS